jgi:16S rRNA processing protein RimM
LTDADYVTVGRVGKPHGTKGAFFVEQASDDPKRFAAGATLLVDGAPVEVVESKRSGGRPVIRVDRPVRRGADLQIERAALPATGPDEYYVFELVGLDVEREDGKWLGQVANVDTGVANDILELDSGLLLPLVEACIVQVDLAARRILVRAGFDEAD